MMNPKILWLLCFIPTLSFAQVCETGTFEKLTNDFGNYVSNLESSLEVPLSETSAFTPEYQVFEEILWNRAYPQVAATASEDFLILFETYNENFQTLDKIYQQNPSDQKIAEYYDCRVEFFGRNIFEAIFPWIAAPYLASSECTQDFLTESEINDLEAELSQQNLINCKTGENDPNLPTAENTKKIGTAPSPTFSFASPYGTPLERNTAVQQDTNQIEADPAGGVESWWRNTLSTFTNLFGRKTEQKSVNVGLRVDNALSGQSIVSATETRRRQWEANRNQALQIGVASGRKLDAQNEQFADYIIKILKDTNSSLEKSLDYIDKVCESQDTKDFCYQTGNRHDKD